MQHLLQNIIAGLAGFAGATIWTKLVTKLSENKLLSQRQARKLSHITTAPFFILTWPLYSTHSYARFIAASVPLSFALRILANPQSDRLVSATSRASTTTYSKGKREEAFSLVAYGTSVAGLTATGWRTCAAVYIAVAALCFGDGAADVVGSAVNGMRMPLPRKVFTKHKTVVGSMAFVVGSLVGATGMIQMARLVGLVGVTVPMHVLCKVAVSSAAVELLPIEDNVTVPWFAFSVAKVLL